MKHFSVGTGDVHGLYYKDGWYINNDWAIDQKIDLASLDKLDDKQLSDREISVFVKNFITKNLHENFWTISFLDVVSG
ncbi:MAG: hypothetical protein LBI53_04150 [Candidatus Peribacteria bacterium]|nr:hypothetical protein [Candidatus Peribacteria bacterium]